ncbi:hypothetical protein B9Z55_015701 [Caenorhabditis nigoni]|uniref:Uncharacterized protein n=1 Tax=Caenorhabditis nigoni TaxID=1611254 RepID=A0A2G5UBD2_9PELO|nr:hypothetical protein B9Z55_015701 [Caenorhabditis nigoni]
MLKASVKNDEITAQICYDSYNKRKSIMNLRAVLQDVVKGKCSNQPVRKEDIENKKNKRSLSLINLEMLMLYIHVIITQSFFE